MLQILSLIFKGGYPSCASRPLLALWHRVHMGCQLLRSQNSPPNRTGWIWSTTDAGRPQSTHSGWLRIYALRALRQNLDQYRVSCGLSRFAFFLRGSGVCRLGIVGMNVS